MSCFFDIEFLYGSQPIPFRQGKSFTVQDMLNNVDKMAPCDFIITKEPGYGDGGRYRVQVDVDFFDGGTVPSFQVLEVWED